MCEQACHLNFCCQVSFSTFNYLYFARLVREIDALRRKHGKMSTVLRFFASAFVACGDGIDGMSSEAACHLYFCFYVLF